MPFNTTANKRVFYATQGVAVGDMGATGVIDSWGTSDGASTITGSGKMIIMHGLQSIGITTNFNLEQIFDLGQLSLYENVETIPDIEVSLEKVMDGYTLLYHAATPTASDPTLTGRSNARTDVRMAIGLDTDAAVSSGDSLAAELYCSGMYTSSAAYSMSAEGNFTETVSLVGNNKKWINSSGNAQLLLGVNGNANSLFNFGSDSPDSPDSGVMRTNNFLTGSTLRTLGGSTFVTVLPSIIQGITNNGSALGQSSAASYKNCGSVDVTNVHVQSISFSVSLGRESIPQLGTIAPYYRYATFPVEVTSDIEVIATGGDNVDAVEDIPSGGNLLNHTIQTVLQDSTVVQVGNKNKLTSVSYGGGDAGGGNATITYSFSNFNDFVILHSGDPISLSKAGTAYFKYWFA